MKKEEQETYDAYFDLFSSKGWQNYIATVIEDKQAILQQAAYDSKTELDLGKAQGALHYLDAILGLELRIEGMYDEAKRNEDDKNYVGQIEDGG